MRTVLSSDRNPHSVYDYQKETFTTNVTRGPYRQFHGVSIFAIQVTRTVGSDPWIVFVEGSNDHELTWESIVAHNSSLHASGYTHSEISEIPYAVWRLRCSGLVAGTTLEVVAIGGRLN